MAEIISFLPEFPKYGHFIWSAYGVCFGAIFIYAIYILLKLGQLKRRYQDKNS